MRADEAPDALWHMAIPFPRNQHDEQEKARRFTRDWAVSRRVMPTDLVAAYFDDLRYTELVCGYYVGAPLPALTAINAFNLWFFAWDDRQDQDVAGHRDDAWGDLTASLHSALDAPDSGRNHPDPLVSAFCDCVDRLFAPLSEQWNARFAGHFHATIDAYDEEYRNRTTGARPTVSQYLELRRHTFGMGVWTDLLELAAACELPPEVYYSDAYQRVALAPQEFSAWYNDLCSMEKELAAGDVHNLGVLFTHCRGLTPRQAAAEVARMAQRRIADYQAAEPEVRDLLTSLSAGPELREAVGRCLFNMRNWFSSVYWFHHNSVRYRLRDWDDPAAPPFVPALDTSQ